MVKYDSKAMKKLLKIKGCSCKDCTKLGIHREVILTKETGILKIKNLLGKDIYLHKGDKLTIRVE